MQKRTTHSSMKISKTHENKLLQYQ